MIFLLFGFQDGYVCVCVVLYWTFHLCALRVFELSKTRDICAARKHRGETDSLDDAFFLLPNVDVLEFAFNFVIVLDTVTIKKATFK